MPTKFKKIISGKYFSQISTLLYALLMFFAAFETNSALCLLTGKPHLYGAVYILFAIIAIVVIAKEGFRFKIKNRGLRKTSAFLNCFILYYLFILLIWEFICLIFCATKTTKAIGVALSGISAIAVVICGYIRTKDIKIKPYSISLSKGNTDYKIALVSDIHLGTFVGVSHIRKMVEKINGLNPDIVVIAGDIFNGDNLLLEDSSRLKEISKEFSKLKTKEGIYAVAGNHDPKVNTKPFKYFMKDAGIKLLNNDAKILSKINLIGRTDDAHNIRTEITEILPKVDSDKPVVVIDHKPENIFESVKHNVDLVLCGHTHKGQLFPITLFTRLASKKGCFYGHHTLGKTHSIITSGVGFFELPMRFGSNNEIADIKIKL